MTKDEIRKQRLADNEMALKTIFLMRKHLVDWLHQINHIEFYFEANEILIEAEQKVWEEIVYGDEDPQECESTGNVERMLNLFVE